MSDPKFNPSIIETAINYYRTLETSNQIAVAGVIMAILAVIIGALGVLVAYLYTRRQGKLAKTQLKQIDAAKNKTKIDVFYRSEGSGRGILELRKTGEVVAKNVIFWHESDNSYFGYTNIGGAEYCDSDNKKIKISTLSGQHPIILHHAHMDSIKVFWRWENPDGSDGNGEKTINL